MKPFTKTASLLTGIVALIHVYRLFNNFTITIGSFEVPHAASIVAALILAFISIGLWMEVKK